MNVNPDHYKKDCSHFIGLKWADLSFGKVKNLLDPKKQKVPFCTAVLYLKCHKIKHDIRKLQEASYPFQIINVQTFDKR